jgi:hypothetical protein
LLVSAVVGCSTLALPVVPADNVQVSPANSGNIQGFVYLKGQPLRGAEVVVFGNWVNNHFEFNQTTITGNPGNSPTSPEPPANFLSDSPITVLHDFGDGKGSVLSQRLLRRYPTGEGDGKFIFLRPGEYFLEGIPGSEMTVQASYDPNPEKAPVDFPNGIKPLIRPEIRLKVEPSKTIIGANIAVSP